MKMPTDSQRAGPLLLFGQRAGPLVIPFTIQETPQGHRPAAPVWSGTVVLTRQGCQQSPYGPTRQTQTGAIRYVRGVERATVDPSFVSMGGIGATQCASDQKGDFLAALWY